MPALRTSGFGGRLGGRQIRGCLAGVAWSVAIVAAPGCVHYQPRPIVPEPALAAIEGRRLDDPELTRIVQRQPQPTPWPPRAWDVPALTLVAFYYHPDLDAARGNWAAARAAIVTAGERPNPNGGIEPGYNTTTPKGQMTPWILTLPLDFTVETAGKRGHRIAAARRLSEAARFNIAVVAWRLRSRVRSAMLERYAATGTAALLERQIVIQERNVGLLDRQLAAGAVSAFEFTQARLALDNIRLSLHDARRLEAEARVHLAGALGVTSHALEDVPLSLESFERALEDLPAAAIRRRALLNRADLLAGLAEYEAAQADLQLQIARQYPDLHLGPGYQMDQADNKWTLGFSGPLPVFNRNRGAIGEAEARRVQAAARFAAIQNRAIEEIDIAVAGYEAARAKAATAEALISDLHKQEQGAQARWRAGEISRLELGVLQLEIANSELARFDALVRAQEALGRLEDAMQSPADLPDWLAVTPQRTTTGGGGR